MVRRVLLCVSKSPRGKRSIDTDDRKLNYQTKTCILCQVSLLAQPPSIGGKICVIKIDSVGKTESVVGTHHPYTIDSQIYCRREEKVYCPSLLIGEQKRNYPKSEQMWNDVGHNYTIIYKS